MYMYFQTLTIDAIAEGPDSLAKGALDIWGET